MGKPQLGVVALPSDGGSIGPAGIHLRWLYPPALGYPYKGFDVFRLETEKLAWECRGPAGQAAVGAVPNGFDAGPFSLHYQSQIAALDAFGPSTGRWLSIPLALNGRELVLAFDEPVIRCRVTFREPRSHLRLRAFSGQQEVARTTVVLSGGSIVSLTVVGSNITAVGVSLDARRISEVCFTYASKIDWGDPLVHLELPVTRSEATDRFEVGLHNRYAVSDSEAVRNYDGPARDLVDTCKALLSPDSRFVDPALPMPELVLKPSAETPLRGYRPHQFLLLAATDPNVARMLGLYWVDRADRPGGPQLGESCTYMVRGLWSDVAGDVAEAVGYATDVGAEAGPLPDLGPAAKVEADIIPGRRWQGGDPLSRVALRWARPDTSVTGAAVTPVAYDVTRRETSRAELLTEQSVAVVPHSAFAKKAPCIIDDAAPLGRHHYAVQPIDVFGQVGDAVVSPEIEVQDLEAPPPPVRVTTQVGQAGFPWRTTESRALVDGRAQVGVTFEYGAAQWRQAPDAQLARLYWRADSPFDEVEGSFTVTSSSLEPDGDRRRWVLAVSTSGAFDPGRFTGGVARIGVGGAMAGRRSFAIVDALQPDRIVVSGAADLTLEPGDCVLRSDPHRRDLWQRIGPDLLLDDGRAVQLTSGLGTVAALATDPHVVATPAIPGQQVVQLDLVLFESAVLDGATVTVGSTTRTVTASRSGTSAQLLLDGELGAGIGATAAITLPGDSPLRVAHVTGATLADIGVSEAERGGELAFEVVGDLIAARVLGAAEAASGGGLQLLVRLPGDTRPGAGVPTRFRRRHGASFTAALTASAVGEVALPITGGMRTGHVALTCVDRRGNEGPLSTAVPFTAVRPPPTVVPGVPHPCGHPTALDGYATPPDANGFATLCLEWATSPDLRYEVGRSLDQTVLGIDRQGWLTAGREPGLGSWPIDITYVDSASEGARIRFTTPAGVDPATLPAPAVQQGDAVWLASRIAGDDYALTGAAQPATGAATLLAAPIRLGRTSPAQLAVVDGQVVADVAAESAARLAGGRLDAGGHRYRIAATRPHGGGGIALSLRPITQDAPTQPTGSVTLNAPPDHTLIAADTAVLRALAGKTGNEDAFALVSGVPLDGGSFRDELPGRGANVFFYRIRGVDPAGNTTTWSPVSVPVHLVDTAPPAPPTTLIATPRERAVSLGWRHDPAGWSVTYHVVRSGGPDPRIPETEIGTVDADKGRGDQHTYVDQTAAGLLPGEAHVYRVRAVKHVPRADGPPIDVAAVSEPVRARAFDSAPPAAPADLTLARTGDTAVRATWSMPAPMTWLLKRQPPGGGAATVAVRAGAATAATFDGARWRYAYDDIAVTADPGWSYELVVTNRLGRQSAPARATEPDSR